MIDPTYDEIDFIRRFEGRPGGFTMQGSIALLKINRLIPEYVTHVSSSMDSGHFMLTDKRRQLAELIKRKHRL